MALITAAGLTALLFGSGYYMNSLMGKQVSTGAATQVASPGPNTAVQQELAMLRRELSDYYAAKEAANRLRANVLAAVPGSTERIAQVPKAALTNDITDSLVVVVGDLGEAVDNLAIDVNSLVDAYSLLSGNMEDTQAVVNVQIEEIRDIIDRIDELQGAANNVLGVNPAPTITWTTYVEELPLQEG